MGFQIVLSNFTRDLLPLSEMVRTYTHTVSRQCSRTLHRQILCVSCLLLKRKTNYSLQTCHYSIAHYGRGKRSEWGLRFSQIWLRRYIFWDATPCSLVNMYRCFRGTCCLWNVVTYLPENMASHLTRPLGLSRLRHYAEEKLASLTRLRSATKNKSSFWTEQDNC